jgi:hypothetical protein
MRGELVDDAIAKMKSNIERLESHLALSRAWLEMLEGIREVLGNDARVYEPPSAPGPSDVVAEAERIIREEGR